MNFKYLCQQYNLGRFLSATELNPGTRSRVWKLETDLGAFLVRTLAHKEQGEREWELYRRLRAGGFAAMSAILVPCFEQGGGWYQVQEHLAGTMPHPAQSAAAMAQLAAALAKAMPQGMIHGDLGPWNMLQLSDGRMVVIDFGAACPGDPYFDFASLFAGVINHTPAEQRKAVCGQFLRELNCDRTHLLEQLHLWAEQGKTRWAGVNDAMAARFDNALNWAKEYIHEL